MNPDQSSSLNGPLANVPRHPKTSVADLETALNILEKHADKISPLKVSKLLFCHYVLPQNIILINI